MLVSPQGAQQEILFFVFLIISRRTFPWGTWCRTLHQYITRKEEEAQLSGGGDLNQKPLKFLLLRHVFYLCATTADLCTLGWSFRVFQISQMKSAPPKVEVEKKKPKPPPPVYQPFKCGLCEFSHETEDGIKEHCRSVDLLWTKG